MSWPIIVVIGVVLIFAFFWVLQFFSDRTYKPTKKEIAEIIQKSIDGRLDLGKFDEFSCVRIAYNSKLDAIREKYNDIVSNKEYFSVNEITGEDAAALNDKGRIELRKLMDELNEIST